MLPRSQQLRDDWGVCRVCASPNRETILDLGDLPLANAFRRPSDDAPEPYFRSGSSGVLAVTSCKSRSPSTPTHCSGSTSTRRLPRRRGGGTAPQLSDWTRQRFGGTDQTLVVEPASNDGCLLREIQRWTPKVLGIEPARNIAAAGERRRHPNAAGVLQPRPCPRCPRRVRPGRRDHRDQRPRPRARHRRLRAGRRSPARRRRSLVIEAPYLLDLVDRLAYDTIYHEHVSYLSVIALDRIFEMAGLELVHVQRDPIHGGSIRFVGSRGPHERDPSVRRFPGRRARAWLWGWQGPAWFRWPRRCLTQCPARDRRSPRRFGYQDRRLWRNRQRETPCFPPANWATTASDMWWTNPLKQGLLTPGTHIPVVGPSAIASDPVDVLLLLAWNLEEEVLGEQDDFLKARRPVPDPRTQPTLRA